MSRSEKARILVFIITEPVLWQFRLDPSMRRTTAMSRSSSWVWLKSSQTESKPEDSGLGVRVLVRSWSCRVLLRFSMVLAWFWFCGTLVWFWACRILVFRGP